jgi:peptidoglycan/xylan/chitin deacetylase (PgdA/CDA1 family)
MLLKNRTLYSVVRQGFVEASFYSGLTRLLYRAWPAGRHDGTVLVYHSVCGEEEFPFIPSHLRVSPASFDKQMEYLAGNFHVVALSELGTEIGNGSRLPFRTVALSFDDGFKDNLTHALPVLLRHGLSASFFVVTDWVGSKRLSWLHRLDYMYSSKTPVDLLKTFLDEMRWMGSAQEVGPGVVERHSLVVALRDLLLKAFPPGVVDDVVDVVWRRHSVMGVKEEEELARRLYLSWDDVEQLSRAGMDIGSHTVSHPKISLQEDNGVLEEVFQSLKVLKERLAKRIVTFAYPFGDANSYNERCRRVLDEAGLEAACALVGGSGRAGNDPLALGRLPVEDVGVAEFAMETAGVAGSLRRALGALGAK